MGATYATGDFQEAAFFALRGREPVTIYDSATGRCVFALGAWDEQVEIILQEYDQREDLKELQRHVRRLKREFRKAQDKTRSRREPAHAAVGQ